MTFTDPNWGAGRIAWRFARSGADGEATRRFGHFPPEVQENLRVGAHLREAEAPAVGTHRGEDRWSLVTSDRIVSFSQGKVWEAPLADVVDATVLTANLVAARRKDAVEEVTVVLTDARQLPLDVESGTPLSGVWNALKIGAGWNRHPPR